MATQQTPNREDIERRAYEIFLSRRGQNGSAMTDWLQAEAELRGRNGSHQVVSVRHDVVDAVLDARTIKQATRNRARTTTSARK